MAQRLQNRVALISGGSRGIGLAIARAYLQEGARVALLATSEQRLAEAISALGGGSVRLMARVTDVKDAQACHAAVEAVVAQWGGLHVLVNNAGIYRARTFLGYSPQDFQDLLDVNLFGVIHLSQAALPHMQAQADGRIVNVASSAGKAGSRNQSAYNVSKHAVVGLTRCLALEAAGSGVTVNAICPGFVQTDMVDALQSEVAQCAGVSAEQMLQAALSRVPMGRFLATDEITGLAVYLGSAESSGMTGQAISIDGGMLTA
jgi:NAD(P)-dependent dehydrogenase (short-subunit alcohol dehydrogenase family)